MASVADPRLSTSLAAAPEQSRGLSGARAAELLARDGPNELARAVPPSPLRMFLRQLQSAPILLLLGACVVSSFLGDLLDSLAIGAVVLINAVVGFLQEHRAEAAARALNDLTARRARVVREGHALVLPASQLVAGDLLLLEGGDVVAADARVLEAHQLAVNQASLTGESAPVPKSPQPAPEDAPLIEQSDRVFMGSSVTRGAGLAEVTATGMRTQLGRIAHLVQNAERKVTPLEQRLALVTRTLLYACLAIVTLVALLGLLRQVPLFEVLINGVSLAVAAIPEGLPALVTVALSLGVQRMAARQVLVRRLSAVETLGSTTVVCTDKTGTLTTGQMTLRELWADDERALLDAAAACCDAELGGEGRPGVGDPTELALLAAARLRGIERADIERDRPRVREEPFDAELKRMLVSRADGVVYVKGALEALLPASLPDDRGARQRAADMAGRGLRVLAIAIGKDAEPGRWTLLGLCGIADPPRPEVAGAVAAARGAGVKVVMITGDHPDTARAIARELGILREGEPVAETVHARTTPEQKLQIVRGWKGRKAIVAMTGDGVNDAPALREAHIGIAMGRAGTEVTREAADIVLADDNFTSIVAAIEEGRGIFESIRKALVYLLATNTAELGLMLAAALAGLPLPLLPIQLLWINLVTDALPAVALAMDPPPRDVLRRPPRDPAEPMLGRGEWLSIAGIGALLGTVSLGAFVWFSETRGLAAGRSLAFSTLVVAQLGLAFSARSPRATYWETRPSTNRTLWLVALLSLLGQLLIHELPATRRIFQIEPLTLPSLGALALLALLPVTVVELIKLLRRALARRSP